jgi:hypothetical protein
MCDAAANEVLPFWDHRRPAGFRLWVSDAAVLTVSAAATPLLWLLVGSVAPLLPLVVGHFFLFCNVFRVHRWSELAWTGLLLLNAGVWMLAGQFGMLRLFLTQSPFTLAAIMIALLAPGYHGVGYRLVRRLKGAGEGGDER